MTSASDPAAPSLAGDRTRAGFLLLTVLVGVAGATAAALQHSTGNNLTGTSGPPAYPAVVQVQRVPDNPSRSYVVQLDDDRLLENWRKLPPSFGGEVGAGFGPLRRDHYVAESMSGWLSVGDEPYDGRATDTVTFTAPAGYRLDRFGAAGFPVWVYEKTGWSRVGTVEAAVPNPAWVASVLARHATPLSRGGLGPDPSTLRPHLARIEDVVVREDDRTLIVTGIHGTGQRLNRLEVDEEPTSVILSAFVGLEPGFAAELDTGRPVAVPLVGIVWRVDVKLRDPLGRRDVVSQGGVDPKT